MDFKPDKNPFKEFPANAQPKTPPNTIYTDGISTKLSTITLTNGKKFVVSESAEEVTSLVIGYKRKIFALFLDSGNKAENV